VDGSFQITRSLSHGHVAAVLGTLRSTGLEHLLCSRACKERDLVVAMVVERIINPGSKLSSSRRVGEQTATTTLGQELAIEGASEKDFYEAMDWLEKKRVRIEKKMAKKHLEDGCLVMYDLTSVYMEGCCCPLARRGYSRDGKKRKLQVEFGFLCSKDGCPVTVEVFAGNTSDPATVGTQISKLRDDFGLKKVVLVSDRGMLTEARIREELKPAELDWISALRGPAIRKLIEQGVVQLELFDQTDLASVTSEDYPARAPHCLPEPTACETTGSQARGSARSHRNRPICISDKFLHPNDLLLSFVFRFPCKL